jgi:hypothetical protein
LHSILQCAQHYKLYNINLWRECVRMVYKMCTVRGKGDSQSLPSSLAAVTTVSGHRQLRQVAGAVGRFTGGRGIAEFLSSKKNSERTRICRMSCDYTFFCGNTTIFHLCSIPLCTQHYDLHNQNLWKKCVRMMYNMCLSHEKGVGWSLSLSATTMINKSAVDTGKRGGG